MLVQAQGFEASQLAIFLSLPTHRFLVPRAPVAPQLLVLQRALNFHLKRCFNFIGVIFSVVPLQLAASKHSFESIHMLSFRIATKCTAAITLPTLTTAKYTCRLPRGCVPCRAGIQYHVAAATTGPDLEVGVVAVR